MRRRNIVLMLTSIIGVLLLGACDTSAPTANVPKTPIIIPTATAIPSTPTITSIPPTPTLRSVQSTEWGAIKGIGAEVKAEPRTNSATVEKLEGFTIVAFQAKLIDESWWERAGGGWIARNSVVLYRDENEAVRAVPKPTLPPTPVPTYNPVQPPTVNVAQFQKQMDATAVAIAATAPKPPTSVPGSTGGGTRGNLLPTRGQGTTVFCKDGQVSTSGGRQGACSGHGGVRK